MTENWEPGFVTFVSSEGDVNNIENVGSYNDHLVWVDRDMTLSPALTRFSTRTFLYPPELPNPAPIGTYDAETLILPYKTNCTCTPQTEECIPVYEATGERVWAQRVDHDPRGHRWQLNTDPMDPLYTYRQRLLPKFTEPARPAIPGTIRASRYEALQQEGEAFWTYNGLHVPATGYYEFERRHPDRTFTYDAYSHFLSLGHRSDDLEDTTAVEVAFFAVLLEFTEPAICDTTAVLQLISSVDRASTVRTIREVAARIALRRGETQPPDDDDEQEIRGAWGWNDQVDILWGMSDAGMAFEPTSTNSEPSGMAFELIESVHEGDPWPSVPSRDMAKLLREGPNNHQLLMPLERHHA